ncbi:hypothetical protein TNCV_1741 [Trichonephila clavipes]|nr:hypothetical protein TNCV_1741 [Trichonephila clavipes]
MSPLKEDSICASSVPENEYLCHRAKAMVIACRLLLIYVDIAPPQIESGLSAVESISDKWHCHEDWPRPPQINFTASLPPPKVAALGRGPTCTPLEPALAPVPYLCPSPKAHRQGFEPRSNDENNILTGTFSPNYNTNERVLCLNTFNVHRPPLHGGSPMVSEFEPTHSHDMSDTSSCP